MPMVEAASSPSIRPSSVWACVRKKPAAASTISAMRPMFFHPARVSEPIVQNLMDIIPSESPATAMIKLENAVSSALTIMPERISLTEVVLPSADERANTRKQAPPAPTKAQKPEITPSPKKSEPVAPSVAPADTPRIYGSAIGFWTTACITQPQSASPLPARKPRIIRGIRICQTICSNATDTEVPVSVPNRCRSRIDSVSCTGMRTAPMQSVMIAETSVRIINRMIVSRVFFI